MDSFGYFANHVKLIFKINAFNTYELQCGLSKSFPSDINQSSACMGFLIFLYNNLIFQKNLLKEI